MKTNLNVSQIFDETFKKANHIASEYREKVDIIHFIYASLLLKNKEDIIYLTFKKEHKDLSVIIDTLKKEINLEKKDKNINKLEKIIEELSLNKEQISNRVVLLRIIDNTKKDFVGSILKACDIGKEKVFKQTNGKR